MVHAESSSVFRLHKPKLVAHRGFAAKYPENTLAGFEAAIALGCQYLELDIQICKDLQAVVIHDTNLQRTGGRNIEVLDSYWAEIQNETIGEAARFGDQYSSEKLPLLSDVVRLLQQNPTVHTFVEIKEESVARYGANTVLQTVCKAIEPVSQQCTLISFDADVLFEAKRTLTYPLGYVLHIKDRININSY